MRKDIKIVNRPINEYMKYNHWIIFKDSSIDINSIIKTNLLAISCLKYCKENKMPFKIGISCKNDFNQWIHPSIKFINLLNNQINPIGLYEIIHYTYLYTNHHEIAKMLQINYPLDVKDYFISNKENNDKNILLCLSNYIKYLEIPQNIEKDIFNHFSNKGYNITLLSLPNISYNNYWNKNNLKYVNNYIELENEINNNNIIISSDNFLLTLSNNYLNKKVIGIYGPSIPLFITKHNSIKYIQLKDNNNLVDNRIKKSCACINPKQCHRGYLPNQVPYCFNNTSSTSIINEIENILNI